MRCICPMPDDGSPLAGVNFSHMHCEKLHACAGRTAEWVPSTDALDKSLLLARDPILFYDEVPLYESELDDNGASQLHVKVGTLTVPMQHDNSFRTQQMAVLLEEHLLWSLTPEGDKHWAMFESNCCALAHECDGVHMQVRVMPKCWFVLLRFWLRVDRVLIRLYETRYLCDFR